MAHFATDRIPQFSVAAATALDFNHALFATMPQPSRRTVRVGESSRGRLAVFFYSEDKADVGHSKHYPVLRTTVVLQGRYKTLNTAVKTLTHNISHNISPSKENRFHIASSHKLMVTIF